MKLPNRSELNSQLEGTSLSGIEGALERKERVVGQIVQVDDFELPRLSIAQPDVLWLVRLILEMNLILLRLFGCSCD